MSDIWQIFDWSKEGLLGRKIQRAASRLLGGIFVLGLVWAGPANWVMRTYLAYETSKIKSLIAPMEQMVLHRAHLPIPATK